VADGTTNEPPLGIVLAGGGARGAYEVGVLKALFELYDEADRRPPPLVLCGTSSGAINALFIADRADDPRGAVAELEGLWRTLQVGRVYRSGLASLWHGRFHGLRNLWASQFRIRRRPHALLDNTPLSELVSERIRFRFAEHIAAGNLRGVGVTAASYTTGKSVFFFEAAPEIHEWRRARREGLRVRLDLAHVLASSALPLLFPAVRIGNEYFGDGSMRQLAPLAPAIHLGASRLVVVGVHAREEMLPTPSGEPAYPTLAAIGGFVLDSLFMDGIVSDLERLERVNTPLTTLGPNAPELSLPLPLRPVAAFTAFPETDLRSVVGRHPEGFPPLTRFFLNRIGASRESGLELKSYLLFDGGYCGELIDKGYAETRARRDELRRVLGLGGAQTPGETVLVSSTRSR
jgi:NTE family protein